MVEMDEELNCTVLILRKGRRHTDKSAAEPCAFSFV